MSTSPAPFQRARSEEQREIRRQAILQTAADMLTEMPVAELSLNELSRRVGLAKSNVLRYFESREAVLLELLDTAWRAWLARLADELPAAIAEDADVTERSARLAATITETVVADPVLWELISVSAAVLERNISPEVARRYKLTAIANTQELARMTCVHLPEIAPDGAGHFAGSGLLAIGAIWPLAHPAEAMLRAYDTPGMSEMRIDGTATLREVLTTVLAGSLHRWPADMPNHH
ncbi:TetR/AcrR family transcriptional regulator [Streptomyces sp. NPDC059629]|uniref:TetR/AcrR family transcriptional regulator n=1 Tax=Streptomyces sp. NPDC059629 TaxID=3346889 RepID=UPI0036A7A65B